MSGLLERFAYRRRGGTLVFNRIATGEGWTEEGTLSKSHELNSIPETPDPKLPSLSKHEKTGQPRRRRRVCVLSSSEDEVGTLSPIENTPQKMTGSSLFSGLPYSKRLKRDSVSQSEASTDVEIENKRWVKGSHQTRERRGCGLRRRQLFQDGKEEEDVRFSKDKAVIELSSESEGSAVTPLEGTSRPRSGSRRRRGRAHISCSDEETEGVAEVADGWLTKRRNITQQKGGCGRLATRRGSGVSRGRRRRRRRAPRHSSSESPELCDEIGGESSEECSLDVEESENWSSQSDAEGSSSCILLDSDSTNWTRSSGESQEPSNSQDADTTRTPSVDSTDVASFVQKPSGNTVPPSSNKVSSHFAGVSAKAEATILARAEGTISARAEATISATISARAEGIVSAQAKGTVSSHKESCQPGGVSGGGSGGVYRKTRASAHELSGSVDLEEVEKGYQESDEGSECEDYTPRQRKAVLDFLNGCGLEDLQDIPKCSDVRAKVLDKLRPFETWQTLVDQLMTTKSLSLQFCESPVRALLKLSAEKYLVSYRNGISMIWSSVDQPTLSQHPVKVTNLTGPGPEPITSACTSANSVYSSCRDGTVRLYTVHGLI